MEFIFEPLLHKINDMLCAPSKDSDQPGHPCSLMGVFAMCVKKALVLKYPFSVHERLVRLDRLPRLICVLAGPRSFHWFCQAAASVFIIHLYKYMHDSSSHAPISSNTHRTHLFSFNILKFYVLCFHKHYFKAA